MLLKENLFDELIETGDFKDYEQYADFAAAQSDIPDVEAEILSDSEILPEGPEQGVATGVANLIHDLIIDLNKNIQNYNNAVANMDSYPELQELMHKLAGEEFIHIGELEKALETVSPNAENITEGEVEAEDNLDLSSRIDESLDKKIDGESLEESLAAVRNLNWVYDEDNYSKEAENCYKDLVKAILNTPAQYAWLTAEFEGGKQYAQQIATIIMKNINNHYFAGTDGSFNRYLNGSETGIDRLDKTRKIVLDDEDAVKAKDEITPTKNRKKLILDDALDENKIACDICEELVDKQDAINVGNKVLCRHCSERVNEYIDNVKLNETTISSYTNIQASELAEIAKTNEREFYQILRTAPVGAEIVGLKFNPAGDARLRKARRKNHKFDFSKYPPSYGDDIIQWELNGYERTERQLWLIFSGHDHRFTI